MASGRGDLRQSGSPKKDCTVLVTGASGVLGSAVVEALDGYDVICLVHRSDVEGVTSVRGDIGEPRLGLDDATYARLRERVDCIVNCAVVSTYTAREPEIEKVNVRGTENLLELCAESGALMYHIGTVLDPDGPADGSRPRSDESSPFSRVPYLRSKREAEAMVRDSGLPASVLRVTLVIGDHATGATPYFQGIHTLVKFMLEDSYGMVPGDPESLADFLPRDTIARAIECMIATEDVQPLCWLTAGESALTVKRIFEIMIEYGQEIGLNLPLPRFMEPDVIDRLVRPALVPELPRRERQRFEYVIEFSTALQSGRVFPSYLPRLAHLMPVPSVRDLEDALWSSLRYWGARTTISSRVGA